MEQIAKHLLIVAVIGVAFLGLASGAWSGDVTYERLLNADKEPHNWLTYYGNYKGWRYSALSQINTTNVKRLVVKWAFQTGPDENIQTTPLVVDGVIYLTNEKNYVFALDAATGKMLWRYNHELPKAGAMPARLWGAGINRGTSLAAGKVLVGTWDGYLVALDAKTGKLLWKVQVGDYEIGQAVLAPPLIVKDKAIVGVQTLEMGSRGYVSAYSLETGELRWRFHTIPGPGEPGNETWAGDSWEHGCGSAWLPATYDPELNLVYIGIDNPCPFWDGEVRAGDNLYTSSILALDPDSGNLRWYFQVIPHDLWDYGAANEPVLVDMELTNKPTKALMQANKNGYFYIFDRTNGRLLSAKPFIDKMNWTKGLDPSGRPTPGVVPTSEGAVICPSFLGAKSWNHMAYSPSTGLVYIPALDGCQEVKVVRQKPIRGMWYLGGEGSFEGHPARGILEALDPRTGAIRWRYRSNTPIFASVLTTAGGLVFAGDVDGNALAFDASNGEPLWKFNTGSGVRGSPVSYAVGGEQYIAVPSGWGGFGPRFWVGAVPEDLPFGSALFVFGLFKE